MKHLRICLWLRAVNRSGTLLAEKQSDNLWIVQSPVALNVPYYVSLDLCASFYLSVQPMSWKKQHIRFQ